MHQLGVHNLVDTQYIWQQRTHMWRGPCIIAYDMGWLYSFDLFKDFFPCQCIKFVYYLGMSYSYITLFYINSIVKHIRCETHVCGTYIYGIQMHESHTLCVLVYDWCRVMWCRKIISLFYNTCLLLFTCWRTSCLVFFHHAFLNLIGQIIIEDLIRIEKNEMIFGCIIYCHGGQIGQWTPSYHHNVKLVFWLVCHGEWWKSTAYIFFFFIISYCVRL